MAYYSGSANDTISLRQALIDACVAEGWSWHSTNEVLSKSGLFLRLQVTSTDLVLLGRTALLAGDAPNTVSIGKLNATAGFPTLEFVWPVSYEVFVHTDPDEVYLVVNYSIDRFQWCAFGQSGVSGMSGSGMWFGATMGGQMAQPTANATGIAFISSSTGGADNGSNNSYISPAWGWSKATSASRVTTRNLYVHSDLDNQGWLLTQAAADSPVGVSAITELLNTQPSAWNSEAALLPMRAYKVRPSNRVSLVADLGHARHLRIDNYEPKQLLTIGSDRWRVFPWLQKNLPARNGSAGTSAFQAINHSGTFGWAIRYEGP